MKEIQEVKDVWLSMTNSDCTEGRGYQYAKNVCESKATALRLGKKGYIQGSDCPVKKSIAVKVGNIWLIPGRIEQATKEDDLMQKKLDEAEDMLKKLEAAGFTKDDVKKLIA
jgi:hypothetical protein